MAAIVVQFGFAMMPLRASSIACGLTSLTTSGTSGSMRQALELSMTMAPASANRGAWAFEPVAPAENSAMSMPERSAVAASSTTISSPLNGRVVPAERAEAKKRMLCDREVALLEQAAHHAADLAGRADDADAYAVAVEIDELAHVRPLRVVW